METGVRAWVWGRVQLKGQKTGLRGPKFHQGLPPLDSKASSPVPEPLAGGKKVTGPSWRLTTPVVIPHPWSSVKNQ